MIAPNEVIDRKVSIITKILISTKFQKIFRQNLFKNNMSLYTNKNFLTKETNQIVQEVSN